MGGLEQDTATAGGGAARRGIPLRSGLLLLVAAALVPALIFGVWMVLRMADTQREAIEERGRHLAQTMAVAVDRELTGLATALQVLADTRPVQDGDLAEVHRQANDLLRRADIRREGIHIVLSAPDGQQLVNTRRPWGTPLPRANVTESFRRVVETGSMQVSDLFLGAVANAPLIAVSVPVWRDGKVAAILSMSVSIEVLVGVLARQELPDGWISAVLDRKGVFIARSTAPERVGTPARPELIAAAQRGSGTMRTLSKEGVPLFNAWAPASASGWTVIIGVPIALLDAPMHQSLRIALAGGAALLVAGMLLTLLVGRRIARPVSELARAAALLGSDRIPEAKPTRLREVDAVARELRDAARRLSDGQAQQRMAIEAGGIGIWRLDLRSGELRGWGRCGEILGLEDGAAEHPVEAWLRHVPEEHRTGLLAALRAERTAGEFELEFPVGQPDGGIRWAAMRGAFLTDADPGSRRAVGILEDVTERRRALELRLGEAASRQAADRRLFAAIIESSTDLVAAVDLDLRLILFNSAFRREMEAIFGRRVEIGQPVDAFPEHRPEERDTVRALWERAVAGERFMVVEAFGDERRLRRHYEMAFDTILDSDGNRIGAFQSVRDVTEREHAQHALRETEEALRQAQKMEAIGHLTGGIAHDFNNLLQAIGSSLTLIEDKTDDMAVLDALGMAVRAVERGATLTQHLLAFSRRQRLEPRRVDVAALVDGMGGLLERTLGGTILIVAEEEPDLWPALVDPNQLEMALLNLAINARDAMPDGGTLTVRTGNAPEGAEDGRPSVLPAGDYVAISVTDSGTGMSDEVASRAFEPFFTTKGVGHGTGLGLSMVHGLAAQSGGAVRLDTRLGRGTTVTLYLPRARVEETAAPVPPPVVMVEPEPSRAATVLVVEDEALVRMATALYLEQAGFHVVEAASGPEALDLIEREAVDIVLTDYAMPGMTGVELVHALRAMRPGLPTLMVTGYAEVPQATLAVVGLTVIQKPYRPDDLVSRLRAILRAAARESVDA